MIAALFLALGPAPAYEFRDRTTELGLTIAGEGACWVDIDKDGWTDLCAGGGVWRNEEGKRFKKIADVGKVVAADYDNDGFPDLFSMSEVKLYRNVGGKSFEEAKLPEMPKTVSRGACWGDFDKDGFADLFIGGYEDWQNQITYPSIMLFNQQGKDFRVGWHEARYRARGVTACDFDKDADLDIYVSNYRLQPNLLRLNDGKGKFKDAAAQYNVVATSEGFTGGHSIGAAWGDFDEDGNIDLFAGNFAHVDNRGDQPKSRFLRNGGVATGFKFEDKGPCGVSYQESYASPATGDYDNDGDLDLFFTTVYATASFNKKNFPVLFRNDGSFKFSDGTGVAGLAELAPTYQASWADFDNDGDLDLVTAEKLFVNEGGPRAWLLVKVVGDGKVVDRCALGAQVRIRAGNRMLTRQVEAGTGEGNQNDLILHFGLGDRREPVDIDVFWPNGKTQKVAKVKPNNLVTITFAP